MQQRIATALFAAITALASSGCGAQQPSAVTPTARPPISQSPMDPNASASFSATAETSSLPTATATISPSVRVPQRVPTTGQPSAQFCAAGETYLAKFPGLPQVQPPAGSVTPTGSNTCVYTSTIGDLAAPAATLAAGPLTGATEELLKIQELCDAQNVAPGASRIADEWVWARGWSGWTATSDGAQQAMLCTGEYVLSASLLDVPGSTADDALATILAAMG